MLYLPRNLTPSAVFYRTTRVYGAFTDLLVLRGRIISVFRGEENSDGRYWKFENDANAILAKFNDADNFR